MLMPRKQIVLWALALLAAGALYTRGINASGHFPHSSAGDSSVWGPPRIAVSSAVQVSRANATSPHNEVQIAIDPTDSKRMIACSHRLDSDQTFLRPTPIDIMVYSSFDGGLSWQPTHEINKDQHNADPACAFGPDGTGYWMSFGGSLFDTHPYRILMPMYRSDDGAKTWNEVGAPAVIDREYITVDDSDGKYRGHVYVHGTHGAHGIDGAMINGLTIYRSADKGANFKQVTLEDEGSQYVLEPGNGVILSDGTFAALFGDLSDEKLAYGLPVHPRTPNAKLKFISSSDGGESFEKATVISDWFMRFAGQLNGVPTLAVDRTNGPFRDRLYAAWVDARSGRGEIRFSVSSDKGKTWSSSWVISDNWPRDARGESPDAFMPYLAVNRNGVVGIMWYDRRDHPNDFGYDARFSASMDGGDSFSPSVLVAPGGKFPQQGKEVLTFGPTHPEPAADGRTQSEFQWSPQLDDGGDTAGMACDSEGGFHPVWISRSTGVQQIWTTRVAVDGSGARNGGGALESLNDLAPKAEVRYSMGHIDLATNSFTIGAAITNVSKDPLPASLTLRLLAVRSPKGAVVVQDADNHASGDGATWEFQTADGQPLAPGALTKPRQLHFKLSPSAFPFSQTDEDFSLIHLDTKILGK
jgi:hypothetical protein